MAKKEWRSFEEARKFVHTLGLKGLKDWRVYCESGEKPEDIPTHPDRSYDSKFKNLGDWLGTEYVRPRDRTYRSFLEARRFVRELGLEKWAEWLIYSKSDRKPVDIPADPRTTYRTEFVDAGDWLGTGNVAPRYRKFRSFAEARKFAHSLRLKGKPEWQAYCKSGEKPVDIPSNPPQSYLSEFESWGDWLGTGNVHPRDRQYRPFSEARAFVRQLNQSL